MFGLTQGGLVRLTHTVGGPRTPPAMCAGTARCASAVAADGVAERGTAGSVSGFESGNAVALAAVRSALDARPRKLQQGGPIPGHPAEVERAYSASRR